MKKETIIHGVRCTLDHDSEALRRFMRDNRDYFVKIRNWGGKTFTYV